MTALGDDLVRIRLDLGYRGTAFSGWATQPDRRTVQGVLETALATLLRVDGLRLTVAGRTDAGVHARGQVAHLDLSHAVWQRIPGRSDRAPGLALVHRLAGVLPPDIVVHRASLAPDGFDARFSALTRRYAFRIADGETRRDPLRSDWTLWSRRPLDVPAMHEAAQPLLGVRDFAAFCKPRPGATTIRDLQSFDWHRPDDGPDAGLVVGWVRSDAFCHNMVRALVGACLAVGEGRRPVGWPAALLASRSREGGASVVPPHGLVLESVDYPHPEHLAQRASAIRARRTEDDVLPEGPATPPSGTAASSSR